MRPGTWAGGLWSEVRRLRWALLAAVIPIVVLDVLNAHFTFQNEMRWVPIMQKLSVISFALVVAHLSWRAMFYYLDLGVMYARATDPYTAGSPVPLREAIVFGAVVIARAMFYLAVILGFSMGL